MQIAQRYNISCACECLLAQLSPMCHSSKCFNMCQSCKWQKQIIFISWITAKVEHLLVFTGYLNLFIFKIFFIFWLHHAACGILVPRPGIEPGPPAVEAWSPNHWTAREFPKLSEFLLLRVIYFHPMPIFFFLVNFFSSLICKVFFM